MKTKQKTLFTQFVTIFVVFVVVSLMMNLIFTAINSTNSMKNRCEANLKRVSEYLSDEMIANADEVSALKNFFNEHRDMLSVSVDAASPSAESESALNVRMLEHYPGKTLFVDMTFDEMSLEDQAAWANQKYVKWLCTFENCAKGLDLEYCYFIYAVNDTDMCYMIDGARFDEDKDGLVDLGFTNSIERATHPNMWETWETGQCTNKLDQMDNENGFVYSAYVPVYLGDELLGLTVSESSVLVARNDIANETLKQTVVLLLVLGVASAISLVFIRKSILNRINFLDTQVGRYSETKDVDIANTVQTEAKKHNDEISRLSGNFGDMINELKNYMTNLEHVTAEKERISTELSVATQIQSSMLPSDYPDCPEYSIYARMTPAKEVGGDFYDFFMIDDDHVGIVIADVSGKGIPAALFMVEAKTIIKNQSRNSRLLENIFMNANEQLMEGNEGQLFVTAWLGVIDIRTGEMQYIEAGHDNPMLVHPDGTIDEITPKKKKMPLATWEGLKYIPNTTTIGKGDKLLLYTDGVPEATNADNQLYGMERFRNMLQRCGSMSPKEMLTEVRADVDNFVGEAPQFDDLTMLAFLYKGSEN